ncbi:MAG: elongation factor G [Actinomycetota bacterium]|nr:elongation factor G [Actinomycetota bacterium]
MSGSVQSYPPARIRNVAFVGHGGVGKTTLTEAILHAAGAIGRPGRVEDGSTVSDHEPEERHRQISLSASMAVAEWAGHKLNLLDCPGYADFAGEALAALTVADLAVFVVSAVDGVEAQTEVLWRAAADLRLPRMIFINKLDRDRASFSRTLEQLRSTFGAGIAPLELPIGEESSFRGVADLLSDTAITYTDGRPSTGPIPDDMAATEHEVHDNLVEGIVVADDELMERYLDGETPSVERLEKTLALGVASAQVFPVVIGSATAKVAVDRLATFICEIGPSPLDRPPVTVQVPHDGHANGAAAGPATTEVTPDPDGQPLCLVWKTVADRHVGRISMFKVLSGTIGADTVLVNARTRADERLHAPFTLRGTEQLAVTQLVAGDLGAVSKLNDIAVGDTLAPKGTPVSVVVPRPPEPVLPVGIRPHAAGDDDKLMTALHRLCEEDPSLVVRRDDETHQTLLVGVGDTHLAVTVERLSRRFGVEVDTEAVVVAYRETITTPADGEGKYKKQTGGHGQYGVATLAVEPLDRGAGFEFVDKVVGGAIPRQLIPAVAKGVEEAMASGGVHGFPVVDLRVTCLDGKYHPVDSSEMSFKMAGALALREALAAAAPVILEPVSAVEVVVPDACQGDVLGDLSSRRGRVQNTEPDVAGWSRITALVPTSELSRYATELRAATAGRGRFGIRHDHYDFLPPNLAEKVTARDG